MAHNLYRFYLYAVSVALLGFAMFGLGRLLQTLLALTPLRGTYTSAPSGADIVQSVVFFIISWFVAGVIGGLHYWRIRRDIQNDATAINSPIRSFFLNITEAIVIAIGVPVLGFGVIAPLGQGYSGVISSAAIGIPLLFMFALLELERRRSPFDTEAVSLFHRLHFYGIQLLLLIFLTFAWQSAFRSIVDVVVFADRGAQESCGSSGGCPTYNPLALILTLLWFTGFWAWYSWLLRRDTSLPLRFIMHFLGFAYGVGFVLYGIQLAIGLAILPLFHAPASLKDITGPGAAHDFFSPLTLGIVVMIVYHLLVRAGAQQKLIEQNVVLPVESAIAGILSAIAFWYGSGYLLYNLLQQITPIPNAPDTQAWVTAIGFLVAGLGYIPLDFYLYRRNNSDPAVAAGSRRGFVLALLGGGLLAFAIGGATALYSWLTAVFGSPFTNWQQTVHIGLAGFIVGVILVGIYLTVSTREKLFSGFAQRVPQPVVTPPPTTPVTPTTPTSTTIEEVLDELLAGKITRDVAAARLHALTSTPVAQ